jgi:hypothetical protein
MPTKLFSDKTKTFKIESVDELLKQVARLKSKDRLYFRGQSQDWKLLPSIGRCNYYFAGKKMQSAFNKAGEKCLLHRFQRYIYEHRGRLLNQWETMFLAKHHGLPVRLLDWTTNPLVALYWACEYRSNADFEDDKVPNGIIYVFWRKPASPSKSKSDIDVINDKIDAFLVKGIRLIYPFYPTYRMTAQSALFTVHQHPKMDLAKITKVKYPNDNDIKGGEKWCVTSGKRAEMIIDLDRLGINRRTLFPELGGLAEGLLNQSILFEHYLKAT